MKKYVFTLLFVLLCSNLLITAQENNNVINLKFGEKKTIKASLNSLNANSNKTNWKIIHENDTIIKIEKYRKNKCTIKALNKAGSATIKFETADTSSSWTVNVDSNTNAGYKKTLIILFVLAGLGGALITWIKYKKTLIGYAGQLQKIQKHKIIIHGIVVLAVYCLLIWLINYISVIVYVILFIYLVTLAIKFLLINHNKMKNDSYVSQLETSKQELRQNLVESKKRIEVLSQEIYALKNKKNTITLSMAAIKEMVSENLQKNNNFRDFVKKELQKYEYSQSEPLQSQTAIYPVQQQTGIESEPFHIDDDKQENEHILYADFINGDEFQNIVAGQPNDLSIFELHLAVGGKTASFQICEGAKELVIQRTAYLAGCNKNVTPGGSVLIQTQGTAREAGGKWFVEIPLKVKIV